MQRLDFSKLEAQVSPTFVLTGPPRKPRSHQSRWKHVYVEIEKYFVLVSREASVSPDRRKAVQRQVWSCKPNKPSLRDSMRILTVVF